MTAIIVLFLIYIKAMLQKFSIKKLCQSIIKQQDCPYCSILFKNRKKRFYPPPLIFINILNIFLLSCNVCNKSGQTITWNHKYGLHRIFFITLRLAVLSPEDKGSTDIISRQLLNSDRSSGKNLHCSYASFIHKARLA